MRTLLSGSPLARGKLLLAATPFLVAATLLSSAGVAPGSLDDAFITLVYARHFAATGRFFWNEADGTVDGFTSLLDVLAKSLAFRVHPDDPLLVSWWLNLAFQLAVPVLAMAIVLRSSRVPAGGPTPLLAFGVGLALATSPSLAYASAFHLESQLFALLLLCAVGIAVVSSRPQRLAMRAVFHFALFLLVLARPEGAPLAFLLLLGVLLLPPLRAGSPRLPQALVLIGLTAAFMAWRLWIFGDWAPNTYYAKTSVSRWNEIADGMAYVGAFVRTPEGAVVLLLGVTLPILVLSRTWSDDVGRSTTGIVFCCMLASIAAVIVSGGDCYPGSRLLLPTVALATLAMGSAANFHRGPAVWIPRALLVFLVLVQLAGILPDARARAVAVIQSRPLSEERLDCHRRVARTLEQLAPQLVVAQTDYQIFKYLSDESRVIDLQGLNDRAIAHRPVSEPVRFGKFTAWDGVRADPHVWFYGYRIAMPGCPPLGRYALRKVLSEPAIYQPCFGYGAPEDLIRAIEQRFVPATVYSCNLNFNFFLRRDLVSRAKGLGILTQPDGAMAPHGQRGGGDLLLRTP